MSLSCPIMNLTTFPCTLTVLPVIQRGYGTNKFPVDCLSRDNVDPGLDRPVTLNRPCGAFDWVEGMKFLHRKPIAVSSENMHTRCNSRQNGMLHCLDME